MGRHPAEALLKAREAAFSLLGFNLQAPLVFQLPSEAEVESLKVEDKIRTGKVCDEFIRAFDSTFYVYFIQRCSHLIESQLFETVSRLRAAVELYNDDVPRFAQYIAVFAHNGIGFHQRFCPLCNGGQ